MGRCRGKSYLDLLRQRAGDCEDAPDAVVAPARAQAVQAVLYACAEAGVAVVPFGGGTSVVGGLEPLRGRPTRWCRSTSGGWRGSSRSTSARSWRGWAAGRGCPEADHALGQRGYMLGHTPQSYEWATVGGCVATRSAGQSSTGHGRIEENVVALRCATPAGELANLPVPATAAGPALKQLVMGSEGILGAITSVGLRVFPLPAARRYEGFAFRDFEAGWEALRAARAGRACAGHRAALRRGGDADVVRAGRQRGQGAGDGRACCAGAACSCAGGRASEGSVALRRKLAAKALRGAGGWPLGQAPGEAWAATRYAGPHLRDDLLDRGVMVETLETATTWSNLAALRSAVTRALEGSLAAPLVLCHLSHVYPTGASLYFTASRRRTATTRRPSGGGRRSRRRTRSSRPAARSPTTTRWGPITRRGWAPRPASSASTLLRALKERCDPAGIMNPGKLLL